MKILIVGENGSGKSVFAEKIACKIAANRKLYIATMIPYGEEGEKKVQKHIKQREGLNFETFIAPYGFADIAVCQSDTVLIEDVSNLIANLRFEKKMITPAIAGVNQIIELSKQVENTICVSINGSTLDGNYDDDTKAYINDLTEVNISLHNFFDIVIEMKSGEANYLKGQKEWE